MVIEAKFTFSGGRFQAIEQSGFQLFKLLNASAHRGDAGSEVGRLDRFAGNFIDHRVDVFFGGLVVIARLWHEG